MSTMSKPVILTGLRANNDLHIGNYFGALLPMVDMAKKHADEYQVFLMMADLHSFSTPIDYAQLQTQIISNLRAYVAAGLPLDHENIRMFRESYIPAHSELMHILDNFTGVGEMERMTQFKDKSAKIGNDRVSMALLNYPPLMAADILLYGATYVPVGDDQTQHIEFTRDIAERMNARFGNLFVIPKPVKEQHEFFGKDQGLRIRDLSDPVKKMSKSDATGKGVIFLSDSPEEAKAKIMAATTDSLGEIRYDYSTQSGVSNLLDIYKLFNGNPEEFIGGKEYGPLKHAVADKVATFLADFSHRLSAVKQEDIDAKLAESEEKMRQMAGETLLRVQQAVGLRGV